MKRVKPQVQPVACEQCGLVFATPQVLEMHYKYMENEGMRLCLSTRSLRSQGFYRSRGAWRLGRKP